MFDVLQEPGMIVHRVGPVGGAGVAERGHSRGIVPTEADELVACEQIKVGCPRCRYRDPNDHRRDGGRRGRRRGRRSRRRSGACSRQHSEQTKTKVSETPPARHRVLRRTAKQKLTRRPLNLSTAFHSELDQSLAHIALIVRDYDESIG